MLFVCHPKILQNIVFSFSWELKWPQQKLNTMLEQNVGVTNKEHYSMLWYFLERAIVFTCILNQSSAVIVSKNTSSIKSRINSLFEQLLYLIKNNGSFFANLPFENTIFYIFARLFVLC